MIISNYKTKEILNIEKIKNLPENNMLKSNPNLFEFWDFEKNKDFNIYEVKKGSDKVVWWNCSDCGSNYDTKIQLKNRGYGCPYCRGLRVNHTNNLSVTDKHLLEIWNYDLNDILPTEITRGSAKKIWFNCDKCQDTYPMNLNKKVQGRGCSICSGYYVTKKNSFGGLYPEIAKEWHPTKNEKLTPYDFSRRSGKKVWWKCRECSSDYEMTIDKRVGEKGETNACKVCSSNLSFGEKVIYELLDSNEIDFQREVKFKWSENKIYDFYIKELNCIIEVHGEQHYNGSFSRLGGRTLQQEIENDLIKCELACKNGIINYITIKCENLDLSKFKKEIINSGLLKKLNLSDGVLDNISKLKLKNLTTETWNLYNHKFDIITISKKLKIHKTTVIKYLKLGSELNKCNYK